MSATPEPGLFGLYSHLGVLWQQMLHDPVTLFSTMAGSPLEWGALVITLASVILAGRQNVWSWPLGLLGAFLYGILFYQYFLFSDVLLQIYFGITQFYGWYYWVVFAKQQGMKGSLGNVSAQLHGEGLAFWRMPKVKEPEAALHSFTFVTTVLLFAGAVAAAWVIAKPMGAIGAALPHWDSLILTASVVGQLLLTRKVVQAWYFWVFVNVIAIGVYSTKELYPTTALYLFFLGNAIYWALKWKVMYKAQKAPFSPSDRVLEGATT